MKSRDTWRAAFADHLDQMNEGEAKVLVRIVGVARNIRTLPTAFLAMSSIMSSKLVIDRAAIKAPRMPASRSWHLTIFGAHVPGSVTWPATQRTP